LRATEGVEVMENIMPSKKRTRRKRTKLLVESDIVGKFPKILADSLKFIIVSFFLN
jgi:hypothetical protein